MNSLLLQFAALTSSFLLTLPPGWCGGDTHEQLGSAPAEAVCCHQTGHDRSSESQGSPVRPTVDCCCSWDATVTQKGAELSDSSSLAIGCTDADFTTNVGSVKASETVTKPFRSGPRLHVLKCLWRC
ncbi:MAG: hypothetical protein WD049_07995 [Candidatus Paceibacterota bacterium]